MATDIGTATMTDVSTAVMPPLNALDVELANHTAGISEINAMNQPAPNGKGKYSVQTEFGTVFENRNWLGSSIIATQRKIMLIIIVAIFRFTLFLPCMANNINKTQKPVFKYWLLPYINLTLFYTQYLSYYNI
jgi:hypothetical protein